jgi:hypothetical protein
MPGLEAVLRITAKDEAGSAFSTLKSQISAIDKQIAVFDRLMNAVGKIAPATDPLIKAIGDSTRALEAQKVAVSELAEGLDSAEGATAAAAGGQERLRAAIMDTTRVMAVQGVEAARVAEKIVSAQRRQASAAREGGGLRGRLGEALPFAGPLLLATTAKAVEAGASVQDEIARLKAAGATDSQIGKARSDFSEFSKTHSGVLEAEYLAGFRDARVIAPGEQFEMARLGATYRAAARNSGLSTSETDVGNVLRIMDELGLKDMGQREDFLNNFIKSQQAFGSQISTETALAAYRNAKQSIYDWSPEFRNKYFPTLLQSSGQQGGTEMMTALNNYIGQHMQQSELRALAAAGFVRNQDLIVNKVGDVKGLKPGSQLFEADMFKSNIAQWAWDFHDTFMQRKGASEGGFDNLIARMPRNMAALIAFLNHNRGRIQRDAQTLDLPVGLAAANDSSLAQNPGAGLTALKDSITQFGAAVTDPVVAAAGPAMLRLAHAIQTAAAAVGDFDKKHPTAAVAGGVGAIAGVGGAGLWLTGKLFGLAKGWLGLGGGAGAAAGGEAAAAGGGWLARLFGLATGPVGTTVAASSLLSGDTAPAHPGYATGAEMLRNWLWGPPPDLEALRESARGHALMNMPGPAMALPGATPASTVGTQIAPYDAASGKEVSVSGQAQVEHTVHLDVNVTLDPALRAKIDQIANSSVDFVVPLIGGGTGRMDSDAAPHRGGIGHQ